MKRRFAVVRSPVICLLAMMGGATLASSTELVDPTEFVPLEVGNRWVYAHIYENAMYSVWEDFWRRYGELDEEAAYWEAYFKQFEVPGYPMGESHPPKSLTSPSSATLVVEITHTEWIDGFEYFVFSEVSYDWPPLPAFFWAGQKVRLSEDGILLFHRNGTDIPLYNFSPRHVGREVPSEWYDTSTSASAFEYLPVEIDRWMLDRLTYPDQTDAVINPAYQDQVLEVGFRFKGMEHTVTSWSVRFVKGYGMGHFGRLDLGPHYTIDFSNGLSPRSAILSGKEVSYKEATDKFVSLVEPELPPIVGQRDKIRNYSGFDFSEGTESYFFKEEKDDIELYQHTDFEGYNIGPPRLNSRIGMADLGLVDFGRLVSAGPVDLRPDPPDRDKYGRFWSQIPQEGHTYAFWTREGGIALMHILDIVTFRIEGRVRDILFDWVYYPAYDRFPNETSVQPASWGQLKNSLLRTK